MRKYNLLTRQLLAQGFDAENHPDYVRVASGQFGTGDKLDNLYGGFEYTRKCADEFVYITGCGLFVMGKKVIDNLSCYGVDHGHENNNPVVNCPYRKVGCEKTFDKIINNRRNGTERNFTVYCECHRTDKPYDRSNSVELEWEKYEEFKRRKYEEFREKRHGQVCMTHAHWNCQTEEWELRYNPKSCQSGCPHQYVRCDILRKEFSGKKGNVFYDIKKTWKNDLYAGKQMELFEKDEYASIEKGLQVFKRPIPIEICEAYAKLGAEEILWHYTVNHSYEAFWNKTIQYEILNVHAMKKNTRDLEQDLKDIQAGISITHASDEIEAKKQKKRDAKEKRAEGQRNRLLRKIENGGLGSLSDNDRKVIKKALTKGEIARANDEYRKKKSDTEVKQLSIFDFMEGSK